MIPPAPHSAPEPRRCQACGNQFSLLNLVINLALAVIKTLIGLLASSRALLASALYSINDVLSAIIVLISMRVARRPADEDHTYGHGKAEFVAIGIVSTVLAGGVIFILFFSVADILKGVQAPPHLIALLVAAATMATNEFLARRGFCAARHLGSPALRTSAEHNRADAISSVATLIGVGGAALGLHLLDPIVAVFETLHIIWLSGSLLGHALRGLMDASLPPEKVAAISGACSRLPGVEGVVNLRTRQAGPQSWVDMEVAVAAGISVQEAHAVTRQVQGTIEGVIGRNVSTQVKFSARNGKPVFGVSEATERA
jgi:cation diffusion facilitator family transporter